MVDLSGPAPRRPGAQRRLFPRSSGGIRAGGRCRTSPTLVCWCRLWLQVAGEMMDLLTRTSMSRASVGERALYRRASVVTPPNGTPPGPVPPPARAGSTAARLLTHPSRSTLSQCAAVVLSPTPPGCSGGHLDRWDQGNTESCKFAYTMVAFGVTFGSVGQKGADSLHLRRSASCLASKGS
jgi:hypothetical protein